MLIACNDSTKDESSHTAILLKKGMYPRLRASLPYVGLVTGVCVRLPIVASHGMPLEVNDARPGAGGWIEHTKSVARRSA